MSRFVQAVAPILKVFLVVAIIAAWVEANAYRLAPESVPAPAPAAATPSAEPAKGDCSPMIDRRNVKRVAPARPAVIQA